LIAIAIILFVVITIMALSFISWLGQRSSYSPAVVTDGSPGSPAVDIVEKKDGGTNSHFVVEVARTQEEHARGLMNRTSLPQENGMLFVFECSNMRYFWMENTLIPLDMIFISGDGQILSIRENTTPMSTDIISSGSPCMYVLEVNGGICQKDGISVGDRVKISL